jgi:uncharacterized UPF0160 family protein
MNWLRSKKTVITHSGSFHPDDVFSVALLSIVYNDKIKVTRTRDEKLYAAADFVLDTGHVYNPDINRFDHHQEGNAGFRENGISFSTFGLLWKKFGKEVCGSEKVADLVDEKFVQVVDADDCGFDLFTKKTNVVPKLMVDAIYLQKPTWKEGTEKLDEYFFKAVSLAKIILQREIKQTIDKLEAEKIVDEIYQNSLDKRVIIFEGYYLPRSILQKYPEPVFIVYKDMMGRMWRGITIDKEEGSSEVRKNFPKSWWGKVDSDLAKVCGVSDAVFCRNSGIYIGAKSKEGVIKMVYKALENNKE